MRPTLDQSTVHRAVARLLTVLPRTNGSVALFVRSDGELDVCSAGSVVLREAEARDAVIGWYRWTTAGGPTGEQLRLDVDAWRREAQAA